MQRCPIARSGRAGSAGSLADLLVDSDVLIDHLRGARALRRPPGSTLSCSVISRCELLAGPKSQEEPVRALLASLRELPVDPDVATAAGLIRRETGIATPDALIAATALRAGLDLMTRNRSDFERVEGLRIAAL